MSPPDLDPDLAAALQVLAELGPLQVLDVRPTQPGRRPASPPTPAPAAPPAPRLFEPRQPPVPALTNPLRHIPSSRPWRAIPRHTGAPRSPTPPTGRFHP
jgi:hypothetical protein